MPIEVLALITIVVGALIIWLFLRRISQDSNEAVSQFTSQERSEPSFSFQPCPKCGQSSLDMPTRGSRDGFGIHMGSTRFHRAIGANEQNSCANCGEKLWETCDTCDGLGQVSIKLRVDEDHYCSVCRRPLPKTRLKQVCATCRGTGRISTRHKCRMLEGI